MIAWRRLQLAGKRNLFPLRKTRRETKLSFRPAEALLDTYGHEASVLPIPQTGHHGFEALCVSDFFQFINLRSPSLTL